MNEFLRDCLDGVVYDRVVTVAMRYTRDEVKAMFLAVIYGHPDHMNTVVGEAVRKLYSAVFDAVVELNYKLGHGGLPPLMQTIESRVMIGRVAGRLVREYPDMPLLTVHDSVVVLPEFVGVVEAVIAEEWTDEFGLAPQTKTSSFTAPRTLGSGGRSGAAVNGAVPPDTRASSQNTNSPPNASINLITETGSPLLPCEAPPRP